jgi:hypothetical protein
LPLWVVAAWLFFATPPSAKPIPYWVEPCRNPETGCRIGDAELAAWALRAWQNASGGSLEFAPGANRSEAQIRILWASPEQGLYGEARPIIVNGKRGAEVFVLPAPLETGGDLLLRDAIVYLTCLHESGHALGLAHTAAFEDIMYSFQYGGDIPEYFGRYRRKLRTRADIQNNSGLSDADRRHLGAALRSPAIP